MVSLCGGIIGILLGLALGIGISAVLKYQAVPSIPAILVSVLLLMSIGIFFGAMPRPAAPASWIRLKRCAMSSILNKSKMQTKVLLSASFFQHQDLPKWFLGQMTHVRRPCFFLE